MGQLRAPISPSVSIRFSSVLFASLTPSLEREWAERYELAYPNERSLRKYAAELDRFAATAGGMFIQFSEEILGVQSSDLQHHFYVCPWAGGSISEPGILNPSRSPQLMKITVLHELAHRLLTRNDAYDIDKSRRGALSLLWRELWGADIEFATLVHIPVFALLQEYVTHSDPTLLPNLDADRRRHASFPAYARAWEIVDQRGSEAVCREAWGCMDKLRRRK